MIEANLYYYRYMVFTFQGGRNCISLIISQFCNLFLNFTGWGLGGGGGGEK